MNININQLTEAELVELNQKIVERLRFFHQMRAHTSMLNFSIGDRVVFDTDDGRTITGLWFGITKEASASLPMITIGGM